ncbi:MAG: hypothetical protein V4692_06825 [Bdellovibrionota bacterium]
MLMRMGVLALVTLSVLAGCSTNRNKAEKIETKIEKEAAVSGDTKVGVKDGNAVVQKKVVMNEELRRLQNDTYELEDRVYGNRKFGSLGLYGVLRDCRAELADKRNGGNGKLKWTESMERVSDKEDEFKVGIDENEQLVGVSEEMLADRIDRFKGYKTLLNKREDEYEEKVAICKNELKNQKVDGGAAASAESASN